MVRADLGAGGRNQAWQGQCTGPHPQAPVAASPLLHQSAVALEGLWRPESREGKGWMDPLPGNLPEVCHACWWASLALLPSIKVPLLSASSWAATFLPSALGAQCSSEHPFQGVPSVGHPFSSPLPCPFTSLREFFL